MTPLILLRPPGEREARAANRGHAIAAKGFRPFFLGAAAFAVSILPVWLLALFGVLDPGHYLEAGGEQPGRPTLVEPPARS